MLIWAWIKRRRAAKLAKLGMSPPSTEDPTAIPPGANAR
jgi:hypothetical protein